MSFNAPIRVPYNNKNNSLSDQASHFKSYIKQREVIGNPVTGKMTKFGGPEGFHHPDMRANNGFGLGKPIAISHHHLAKSIRDNQPKFVYDKRFCLPSEPVLFHHPEPRKRLDYQSKYNINNRSNTPVTLSVESYQPKCRTHSAHELAPAGLRLSKFTYIS